MTDPTDNPRPGRPARRSGPLGLKPDPTTEAASGAAAAPAAPEEARIAKVLARAGLCSRRDAEGWILAGRVAVNGAVITSPALNVGPDDSITVDGHPIDKAERTRLFMFHKTRGLVTTAKDPEGRPTIYDALSEDLPRLITIGRLDINTEGLLLLTNDGGLARLLELPSTGWLRRYRVRAKGEIDQPTLDRLADGITIDGVDYIGIEAKLDRIQGSNLWLTMGLREGKNREIKRVLEHLGLLVNRLIRISFGPFQLGELAENAVEEVRTQVLRDQLGPALAREAGVDLEGPATAAVVTREVRKAKADERRAAKPREGAPSERTRPVRDVQVPRQHVSALRADRADKAEGPRRKTQRSETADRKGRSVAVERVTVAVRRKSTAAPTRNARRFEADRSGEGRADPRPVRRERSAAPEREFTARPERGRFGEGRPAAEGADARPQRAGRPRTVRQADADYGKPRSRSDDATQRSGPRGPRRPEGERPRREEGAANRPARSSFRDERSGAERPRTERPRTERSGAERPRPERSGADRPRPERSREERPRTGSTRPSRPGGDKPGFKGKPRFEGKPDRSSSAGRPATGRKPPGGTSGRTRPGGGGGGRGRPPKS